MVRGESFWSRTSNDAQVERRQAPAEGTVFDVLVVGAGITGVTLAYELAREGKRVAVVERGRVGHGDTAYTTAHLTEITDTALQDLASRFGVDTARDAWRAGEQAIDTVEAIAAREGIPCDFERLPALVIAHRFEDMDWVYEEYRLAEELGFPARMLRPEERPLRSLAAFELARQAKFHPLVYVRRLAESAERRGVAFFEERLVEKVEGESPFEVVLSGGERLRAERVCECAHQPLAEHPLLQTKILPFMTYAIAAEVPKGALPAALVYDTDEPYHYLRVEPRAEHDLAIFGGADHRTGERLDTAARFLLLEEELRRWLPRLEIDVVAQWSGEFLEPVDGLPFVGEVASGRYVATGFSGTGMTFGTYAATLIAEQILGRETGAFAKVLAPGRLPYRNVADYVKENAKFPWAFVVDRVVGVRELGEIAAIPRGEGAIVNDEGKKIAVHRDAQGQLQACSAVCTHMACIVSWNTAQKSWDCRCHGSRFDTSGAVRAGPATKPLERVVLDEEEIRREAA